MAKTPKDKRADLSKVPVPAKAPPATSHAIRETIESIVIAFVLAFLFRTFEAEAFVIPTGSMAPTLMGRHKDVECPKCGYRYQVTASEEEKKDSNIKILAGMCPVCHYTMPMRPDLPRDVPEAREPDIPFQKSYNGDRILVNKYIYTFTDPQRWDVVVFKFPGNAQVNYIKRLVGLPGEKLRIFQGDLFVGDENAQEDADFKIARKPPEKILAMRQLVHDTDYDPAELESAGWPLRWEPQTSAAGAWKVEKKVEGSHVRQQYTLADGAGETSWLRYRHVPPDYLAWQMIAQNGGQSPSNPVDLQLFQQQQRPRLITDANPYNAREDSIRRMSDRLEINPQFLGIHWVGDLLLEADVNVEAASGELLLDLVEGGKHFTCTIDLKTGEAKLSAEGDAKYSPTAKTALSAPGKYHVAFSNFDDELLLWIDGKLIQFDKPTAYDIQQVFGQRSDIIPRTSAEDPGDLAPAGIGGKGAKLTVSRLQLWHDIYYIADDWRRNQIRDRVTDFEHPLDPQLVTELPFDPTLWRYFKNRAQVDFQLGQDQFFVMGDNSAESSDARLWAAVDSETGGQPGGPYLERKLLIGKALCVYWPHSWYQVPGTPIPLFPNFPDMRLVR